MHGIIKTHRQKAWDDGVAPSVHVQICDLELCKLAIHGIKFRSNLTDLQIKSFYFSSAP